MSATPSQGRRAAASDSCLSLFNSNPFMMKQTPRNISTAKRISNNVHTSLRSVSASFEADRPSSQSAQSCKSFRLWSTYSARLYAART